MVDGEVDNYPEDNEDDDDNDVDEDEDDDDDDELSWSKIIFSLQRHLLQ